MSRDKPLAGKRIVVTRAPEQAAEFVAELEALGARVLLLPMITFAEPEDVAPLDNAITKLDKFDWVIFTSRNAVKYIVGRMKSLRIPPERVSHLMLTPHIATIGTATSHEALSVGFLPNYEAEESTGKSLASELLDHVRGKRVLVPRSDLANSPLPQILRDAGADVVEVIAYRTIKPQSADSNVLEAIRCGKVDVVTLFSPSAYDHLVEEIDLDALRRHSGKMVLATIGPVTSSAVKSDGLQVAIEASNPSAASLCEAIAGYFESSHKRAIAE